MQLASNLDAIVHKVICQGRGPSQVSTVLPALLLVWRCERMVQSLMPLLLFVPFKHGEVCDP